MTLGGENRFALVNTGECDSTNSGEYAILLQPLLFESNDNYFTNLENAKGLECVNEIYGVLVEKGNRVDFKVKVTYYGLGYGNERRPMLQALPPGTVIKLKQDCKKAKAIGILSELGFGSIYKINLT